MSPEDPPLAACRTGFRFARSNQFCRESCGKSRRNSWLRQHWLERTALSNLRCALTARSAGAERIHPLDVPGHCNEAPLAADIVEPAQQELAESHHRFDDAEHRFRSLFAQ